MKETNESRSPCEGLSVEIRTTEKGVTISLEAKEARTIEVLKSLAKCCGEAASVCCPGDTAATDSDAGESVKGN